MTLSAASDIPYAESFETYYEGFEMPGTDGWQADSSSDVKVSTNAALISTLNNYQKSGGCRAFGRSAEGGKIILLSIIL